MTRTEKLVTRRDIGKCHCGIIRTQTWVEKVTITTTPHRWGGTTRRREAHALGNVATCFACTCGRTVRFNTVRGVKNPAIKCNDRCTSATGHQCECSCGGKKHGSGHTTDSDATQHLVEHISQATIREEE